MTKSIKGKLALIFALFLVLTTVIPISAGDIEYGSSYRLTNYGVPGFYYVLDSDNNVIDYVVTNDYLDYLASIYPEYKSSDNYRLGYDFEAYIYDIISYLGVSPHILYAIAGYYQQSQLLSETKIEFENYKLTDSTITEEEFSSYLQANNKYLSYYYNINLQSFVNEMIAASSSSSGSSGSSGSTVPGESQGEHYGDSHYNSNHSIADSDCCYNPGYTDGLLDGEDVYINSEEYKTVLNENSTQAIEEYKISQEFIDFKESLSSESAKIAVEEYLKSEEYQLTKDSCYAAGSDAGYTNAYSDACSEVYSQGKIDGYAEFRGSMEYSKTVNSAYDSGWDDGVKKARESAVNPGGVIASIFVLAGLIILLFILSRKKKKKNK